MEASGMFQINLGNLVLTVDAPTYESLQDPDFARRYLIEVERQISGGNKDQDQESPNQPLIWTAKKPTQQDIIATSTFLEFRKELKSQFDDKKSNKNQLWQQIAIKLKNMGFNVGEGISGREKCRQKFMNLQMTYFKYQDLKRQTGEGSVKVPQFFDELEEILGNTHKANPALLIDSSTKKSPQISMLPSHLQPSSSNQGCSSAQKPSICVNETFSQSSDEEEPSNTPKRRKIMEVKNRFTNLKKTVRPRRTVLTTVENVIKEERKLRQEQFKDLLETINKQNELRHEQTMGLIEALKGQKKDC